MLRAPRRFDLLGVRGADAVRGRLEVRARRRGGAWSPLDAARRPRRPRARHRAPAAARLAIPSGPAASDELQLRARRGLRGDAARALRRRPGRAAPAPRGTRVRAAAAPASAQPGTPPPIIPRSAWGGDSVPPRSPPQYGEVQLAFVHHTVTANDYTRRPVGLDRARRSRSTTATPTAGTTSATTSSSTSTGRSSRAARAGSTRPSSAPRRRATTRSRPASRCSARSAPCRSPRPRWPRCRSCIGWKLSLHGVPLRGRPAIVAPAAATSTATRPATPVTLQRISGHRDGDATECPGDALYAQLPELRRRAAALAGPGRGARPGHARRRPPTRSSYGADAVFTGSVIRPDSTAGAGEAVAVQKRGSRRRWVTVGRTTRAGRRLVDRPPAVAPRRRRAGARRRRDLEGRAIALLAGALGAARPPSACARARWCTSTGRVRPAGRRRRADREAGLRRALPPRDVGARHAWSRRRGARRCASSARASTGSPR